MRSTVFLLHGLGPSTLTRWSLIPLRLYLTCVLGLRRVHIIRYPVNTMEVEEMVDFVDVEMRKHCSARDNSVILIGQSMGGVVANRMHTKGWNVAKSVYIGSPLNGARLLKSIDSTLPTPIRDYLFKKPYEFLMDKEREEAPPHPYHTISMSWPGTSFDGCVFRDEATLEESHHTHLPWADHRTIFLNPRLWYHVGNMLVH